MAKLGELALGAAVELFLIAVALGVLYRLWGGMLGLPRKQIVLSFQRGVLIRNGQVEKALDPGSYWISPKRTLVLCDVRPAPFQVAGQELATADGMGIRISLGGEYRIASPALFATESSDAFGAFYLEVRQALRVAVGEMSSQQFLSGQSPLTARMKELLVPKAAQLGIEITQLQAWEAVPVGWLRQT